jgi:hypothetical protein
MSAIRVCCGEEELEFIICLEEMYPIELLMMFA